MHQSLRSIIMGILSSKHYNASKDTPKRPSTSFKDPPGMRVTLKNASAHHQQNSNTVNTRSETEEREKYMGLGLYREKIEDDPSPSVVRRQSRDCLVSFVQVSSGVTFKTIPRRHSCLYTLISGHYAIDA
jgi:hypothetical protein